MRKIETGIYRHFKGNYYRVLCIATHTETDEKLVIYEAQYDDHKIYARPYQMFVEKTDRTKYPNARQEYRFEWVGDTMPSIEDIEEK